MLWKFFCSRDTNWLDVLEALLKILRILCLWLDSKNGLFKGYYELNDIIGLFNETPFFSEAGGILIVEKGLNDYSFSEVSQIVESNDGKLLGAFILKLKMTLLKLLLKLAIQD